MNKENKYLAFSVSILNLSHFLLGFVLKNLDGLLYSYDVGNHSPIYVAKITKFLFSLLLFMLCFLSVTM